MATMDVKDANKNIVTVERPLPPGRAAAAASRPVVLSTEDAALLAPGAGAWTDRSGAIAAGGQSQQLAAANAARRRLRIQNPSSSAESIFVNYGAAATIDSNSFEVMPGGYIDESNPASSQAVHVIAATTGTKFIAKEL